MICDSTTGLLAAMLLVAPEAAAAQDFYRGKSIDIIVATSPAGGYDQYARLLARHLDHDGLVHLVGDDFAYNLFAPSSGFLFRCLSHYFFSVPAWAAISRCRSTVFTRAMSLRSPRTFFRLSVCPMFIWNFSLKSWSASSRSCV
jgi:hypothetical protein